MKFFHCQEDILKSFYLPFAIGRNQSQSIGKILCSSIFSISFFEILGRINSISEKSPLSFTLDSSIFASRQSSFILDIQLPPHCSIYPSSLNTLAITLFLISDLPNMTSSIVAPFNSTSTN